jgi:hypothetical protein
MPAPDRPESAVTLTARLVAALYLLAPLPALAQIGPPGANAGPSAGRGSPAVNTPAGAKETVKEAPPPALPGAEPATEGVIPTDKAAADLPPTEALFDSIHRGDVASARDALSRGAELDGRNVLGQSPLDLSIDLNRNDITFLLLSMRGPGGADRGPREASAAPASAEAPAARGRRGRAAREAAARPGRGPGEAGPDGGARPVLFANDGGVPRPSVGFLGFALR